MASSTQSWANSWYGNKPIIGMIHLDALPGTPKHKYPISTIIEHAVAEAKVYKEAGIDAIAIENMHDVPYLNKVVGPEVVSVMAIIGYEVKRAVGLPTGIQILAAANKEAIAVAHAGGLDFVRAEGFVFAHVADEGIMSSCAGEILRYRKQIGADSVLVWTDIKKKHSSHSITADVSIKETATAAEYFLSDGVIVTGAATGQEASIEEIRACKQGVNDIPVLVGSGVTLENLEDYLDVCDGLIVGSYFKTNGDWMLPVNLERTKKFMDKVHLLRQKK
jgi:membrane complex biogenesis BtpA family protein